MVDEKVLKELVEVEAEGDLRLVWIDPNTAVENERNWRIHPSNQTEAVRHLIFEEDGVGWAGAGLINERKMEDGWAEEEAIPTLIDGHDRRKVAIEEGGAMPFLVGSWGPDDEKAILATLDPIGAMAVADVDKLSELLEFVSKRDSVAAELCMDIAAMNNLFLGSLDDIGFKDVVGKPKTEIEEEEEGGDEVVGICPNCGEPILLRDIGDMNGKVSELQKDIG